MSDNDHRLTSIEAILEGSLKNITGEKFKKTLLVKESWPSLVGKTVAAHCEVLYIKNKKLYVSVDHSTWKQQLEFMKKDIQQKIVRDLGVELDTILFQSS